MCSVQSHCSPHTYLQLNTSAQPTDLFCEGFAFTPILYDASTTAMAWRIIPTCYEDGSTSPQASGLSGSAGSGGITRQRASEPSPPKPSVTIKNRSGLAHGQWPLHNNTTLPLLCCTCTSLSSNLMHSACPAWLLLGPWHSRGGTFR